MSTKNLDIIAVDNVDGDATFFRDGLVYVIEGEVDFSYVHELDLDLSEAEDNHSQEYYDNFKHREAEELVYAVSLKDLVNAAIESGLMDKLTRKTRYKKGLSKDEYQKSFSNSC